MEFLQLHLAGDSRLLISATCCSSFSSRFRGFPDMVSVRDERPARDEDAHKTIVDHWVQIVDLTSVTTAGHWGLGCQRGAEELCRSVISQAGTTCLFLLFESADDEDS